jgi:hypothetical protein
MAKSDLLKQAIADAKAVKETALANAKIALQEAFAPRLEGMLTAKLSEELEDDEMDINMDMDAEPEAGMEGEDAGMGDFPEEVNVGLDFNNDGDYDITGMLGGAEEEMEAGMEAGAEAGMEAGAEAGMEAGMETEEDDLNLDEILRELEEGDMYSEEDQNPFASEGMYEQDMSAEEPTYDPNMVDSDINEIIEAILREEEGAAQVIDPNVDATKETELEGKYNEAQAELHEAYRTVKHLKSVINEVNLLNAKLLYTNKLFRNFDLNEGQKMKVIENFDRAFSTREAKLVFATLAESFNKPQQKRKMVKESAASRAISTTAPSRQTTQILSEGFEMANRWKKLAGLI